MIKFLKNILKTKKSLIILTILLFIVGLYIYSTTFYVIVRFNELGALSKNMVAYYNGFKVGKIVKIGPDKNFKHTLVRINLIHNNIDLPQNTTVSVKNFPNGELYLKFLYPSSPSFKKIKRGSILEGIAPYSLEQFMLGQKISGVTDIVSLHVINTLNATELANKEIQMFFKNSSKLINENSKGIKASINNTVAMTKSLAQMAENLNLASIKINNALDESKLTDTTSNIKDTTDNIAKATKDMDKTMKRIDDIIYEINAMAKNLKSISKGIKETLSKRFAGMRIIFGTPVKLKKCIRGGT